VRKADGADHKRSLGDGTIPDSKVSKNIRANLSTFGILLELSGLPELRAGGCLF
jgi:hypothetical protein